MTASPQIQLQIPQIFSPLLRQDKRYRYYVLYGGRGAAKSWSIARCLIILAYSTKKRILCTREYQRSIADSVHKLLRDQINDLGLSAYFRITDDKIISLTTGSEFIFRGLHCNSAEIKSLEGIDICWIEEAHSTTQESLKYLIPTIRKEGSEIWISFNPDSESDPVYQKFVVTPPDNAYVCKVNYSDNPYISKVLLDEMEHCKTTNYDAYKNIWLGECKTISDAVIFKGKYSVKDFETPDNTQFCYGSDLGFAADPTVLIRCYELVESVNGVTEKNLYIDYEAYGLHVEFEQLSSLFSAVPLADKHRVNFDCSRPETISYLKRTWNPLSVGEPKQKIEDRIEYIRSYSHIYIHPRCIHTLDEFGKYSYKLDGSGNPTRIPLDKDNHCLDSISYSLFYKIKSKTQIHFSNGTGLNI